MTRGYNIGLKMSKPQLIVGWLYLPIYLVLLSVGLQMLANLLGLTLSTLELNAAYFGVNFVFILAVYHKFLLKSIRGFTEHFWKFVQTLVLGFALYYFTNYVLTFLLDAFTENLQNFNNQTVQALVMENKPLMFLCAVVITPLVEETLLRGVVFGSFHPKARIVGYLASALIFSAMHVWQYYPAADLKSILLNALQYVPSSVALCWTYEKAGTLWAPIILHGFINAIAFGVTVFF